MLSLRRGIIPAQKEKKRDLPGTEQPYVVLSSCYLEKVCFSSEGRSTGEIGVSNSSVLWKKQCGHRHGVDFQSLHCTFH